MSDGDNQEVKTFDNSITNRIRDLSKDYELNIRVVNGRWIVSTYWPTREFHNLHNAEAKYLIDALDLFKDYMEKIRL